MFYEEYNTIQSSISKFFKTKKSYLEVALQYEKLSTKYNSKDPFESQYFAKALFGAIEMYEKAEEYNKVVEKCIESGQTFIFCANFHFENCKSIKETWEDHISNAIKVYKIAINVLNNQKKHNLSLRLLNEIGDILTKFELFHQSGSIFENATNYCITNQLSPGQLFEVLSKAIINYSFSDRNDLALILIDYVQRNYKGDNVAIISKSNQLSKELKNLRIFRSIILLMLFKRNECIQFSHSNLDNELSSYFEALCDATLENQISIIDALIQNSNTISEFNINHIKLLKKHLDTISNCSKN